MQCLWIWLCMALLLHNIGATNILFTGLDPRDTYLSPNDDGYDGPISLPSTMQLFGTNWSQCYVDNNGVVSFNQGVSTFTPPLFTEDTSIPMLGIWFADVDTRVDLTDANKVSYRIANASDLAQIRDYLGIANLQYGFIVTWLEVGYYNQHVDKLNTFQMVLAWTQTSTSMCYFYEKLEWTTGDASLGSEGKGGVPAVAGFSDGLGTAYNLPGSGTNDVLKLSKLSGGTLTPRRGLSPGVWCFDVSSPCSLTCLSDGNPCTVDACDQTKTCQHTPIAAGTVCAMNALCTAAGSCECQAGYYSTNPVMGCSLSAPLWSWEAIPASDVSGQSIAPLELAFGSLAFESPFTLRPNPPGSVFQASQTNMNITTNQHFCWATGSTDPNGVLKVNLSGSGCNTSHGANFTMVAHSGLKVNGAVGTVVMFGLEYTSRQNGTLILLNFSGWTVGVAVVHTPNFNVAVGTGLIVGGVAAGVAVGTILMATHCCADFPEKYLKYILNGIRQLIQGLLTRWLR